jgi:hypothetical protein
LIDAPELTAAGVGYDTKLQWHDRHRRSPIRGWSSPLPPRGRGMPCSNLSLRTAATYRNRRNDDDASVCYDCVRA